MTMLKKATLAHGGKPIVLKNPPNTVRIRQILKLFPGAKFVFIKRNPYHVYASMMRMMTKEIPRVQLQHDTLEEVGRECLFFFFFFFFFLVFGFFGWLVVVVAVFPRPFGGVC